MVSYSTLLLVLRYARLCRCRCAYFQRFWGILWKANVAIKYACSYRMLSSLYLLLPWALYLLLDFSTRHQSTGMYFRSSAFTITMLRCENISLLSFCSSMFPLRWFYLIFWQHYGDPHGVSIKLKAHLSSTGLPSSGSDSSIETSFTYNRYLDKALSGRLVHLLHKFWASLLEIDWWCM